MGVRIKRKTKKRYEDHLNECFVNSDQYILGGKMRTNLMYANKYGTALRRYDPIAFEVGYSEWSGR